MGVSTHSSLTLPTRRLGIFFFQLEFLIQFVCVRCTLKNINNQTAKYLTFFGYHFANSSH